MPGSRPFSCPGSPHGEIGSTCAIRWAISAAMKTLALVVVFAVAACGDDAHGITPDASPDAPGPFSTAPHTLPQAIIRRSSR